MDFSFNEEQTLIQRQVAQFIQRDYEWEKRQALAKSELGFSSENWKIFADLGWLGISLSEESGGERHRAHLTPRPDRQDHREFLATPRRIAAGGGQRPG